MVQVVEAYILERTGKVVRIVFNNPNRVQIHLLMLQEAYSVAVTNKTT